MYNKEVTEKADLEAPNESRKKLPATGRAELKKFVYTMKNGVHLSFSVVYI